MTDVKPEIEQKDPSTCQEVEEKESTCQEVEEQESTCKEEEAESTCQEEPESTCKDETNSVEEEPVEIKDNLPVVKDSKGNYICSICAGASKPVKGCCHDGTLCERVKVCPLELEIMEPIPEKVEWATVPKVNEARVVWRAGMRKLEEVFAEHIANMHLDFDDRANQYQAVSEQIDRNLAWIDQHYVNMQQKLNQKHQLIHDERDDWEAEKKLIRSINAYDSDVVRLNVGGQTHLLCEKTLLTSVQDSHLATLFNEMHALKKVDNEVFLDRNGKTFETLIDYLRNDRKVFPEFGDRN